MSSYIKVLPGENGDCFLLKLKTDSGIKNILIDGGKGDLCHQELKKEFLRIKQANQRVNLLVVTHIDDDHIAGIIKLFEDKEIDTSIIDNAWFNSGTLISSSTLSEEEISNREVIINTEPTSKKMSVGQGISLEGYLNESGIWNKDIILTNQIHNLDSINIKILSPDVKTLEKLNKKWDKEKEKIGTKIAKEKKMAFTTDYDKSIEELCNQEFKEDSSLFNRSSIAFLLENENYRLLMLGDSHPSVIVSSLKKLGYSEENKLKIDIMKVSHHASKKNTCPELLKLLDCENFIISSDGSKHGLPNKQSLARIVKMMDKEVNFYFNYDSMKKVFSSEECDQYKIHCNYLDSSNDYTVGDKCGEIF
ncbi:MBL fold metallo-hydrolase [Bacillus weihaiensis]|uniref:MBL fold metallo-hydrolase n=1 Tax=Bacillus weihaiensis TaxID=1547283 RepID=UPI0023542A1B|nr:MBL fold metallo-hydrolase [Bacillus weihaiensis]